MAKSELDVNSGDIQGAFKKLRTIGSDSPYFMKARVAAANLYLEHKKDKISYVKCYIELMVGVRTKHLSVLSMCSAVDAS